MSSSTLPHQPARKSLAKLLVIAALALLITVSALPQYTSSWPWATPPKLIQATRIALQSIPDQGVDLPGWVSAEQTKTKLGGHTWSVQQLSADTGEGSTPIFLLLRPQVYESDQPEVEWLDVKGSQSWTTDSYQKVAFDVPANGPEAAKTIQVSGDFFRAWSQGQTYAVLQWYAWPTGGSASAGRWFWADQRMQWQHYQRMPWVAVSLWLPVAPLSDIEPQQARAVSIGETLQQTLLKTVFEAASADTSGSSANR